MKRMLILVVLSVLMFQSCGGKDAPGAITLNLEFDGTVSQGTRNSIDQFVFIIGKTGSSQKLLYPSACLGCNTSTTPCPTSDQCLESTNCGFSRSDASFDPQIDFADVAAGDDMDVISCALDNTSAPVSAGEGTLQNKTGEEATITMSSDATICINNLPATICP